MATQLYVMPVTGTGTDADPRRPKYADTDLAGSAWAAADYGNEPVMLVATATNAALAAEADVTTVPLNLDQKLTAGAVTVVQTQLEAMHIPVDWVSTALTYRQVLRRVSLGFQFWQRAQGLGLTLLFTGGVTLSTTFGSLPANVRTTLQSAAVSFGLDTSSLTGASTLRQIINTVAPQLNFKVRLLDVTL